MRRLVRCFCGRIGGGPNAYSDHKNATKSQWYNACVSDGTNNAYPYGNAHDGQACNGQAALVGTTMSVESLLGCQSYAVGYEGVYDLSGNIMEWEDSCDQYDDCPMRGGSFISGKDELRCDSGTGGVRHSSGELVGFRCCAP
jgi:sulfatase modifying factor 1